MIYLCFCFYFNLCSFFFRFFCFLRIISLFHLFFFLFLFLVLNFTVASLSFPFRSFSPPLPSSSPCRLYFPFLFSLRHAPASQSVFSLEKSKTNNYSKRTNRIHTQKRKKIYQKKLKQNNST